MRNIPHGIVQDNSGWVAMVSAVLVVIVGAFVALLVWQPWNAATTSQGNPTVQAHPGALPRAVTGAPSR